MSNTADRNAFPYSNGLIIYTGMTMHMYFAGQALAGLLGRDFTLGRERDPYIQRCHVRGDEEFQRTVGLAWRFADAMCKAYDADDKRRGVE